MTIMTIERKKWIQQGTIDHHHETACALLDKGYRQLISKSDKDKTLKNVVRLTLTAYGLWFAMLFSDERLSAKRWAWMGTGFIVVSVVITYLAQKLLGYHGSTKATEYEFCRESIRVKLSPTQDLVMADNQESFQEYINNGLSTLTSEEKKSFWISFCYLKGVAYLKGTLNNLENLANSSKDEGDKEVILFKAKAFEYIEEANACFTSLRDSDSKIKVIAELTFFKDFEKCDSNKQFKRNEVVKFVKEYAKK